MYDLAGKQNVTIDAPISLTLVALMFLLASCASSPEAEEQEQATKMKIEDILRVEPDAADYGEAQRCIGANEYRDFRALDDQHILFEGRRDKLWLNTLRMRCFDLRDARVLRVKSISTMGRICDTDSFQAGDWFDRPWYRRWGSSWNAGMTCSLGKFQPVSEAQAAAIELALGTKSN